MIDLTTEQTETTDEVMLATYVCEGLPFIYWGELYYDLEDKEQRKIILKKPLLQIINPKEGSSKFMRVPSSGRDSIVVLDTFSVKGILVKNPDADEILNYRDSLLRLFSKLHLA